MISHMSTDRKSKNKVSRPARNAETLYLHLQKVHRSMSWQVSRFVHIATRISFNLRSSDDKFLNCAFWWRWSIRFAPRIIVSQKVSQQFPLTADSLAQAMQEGHGFDMFSKVSSNIAVCFCLHSAHILLILFLPQAIGLWSSTSLDDSVETSFQWAVWTLAMAGS